MPDPNSHAFFLLNLEMESYIKGAKYKESQSQIKIRECLRRRIEKGTIIKEIN